VLDLRFEGLAGYGGMGSLCMTRASALMSMAMYD
jgi:hypothetical protein